MRDFLIVCWFSSVQLSVFMRFFSSSFCTKNVLIFLLHLRCRLTYYWYNSTNTAWQHVSLFTFIQSKRSMISKISYTGSFRRCCEISGNICVNSRHKWKRETFRRARTFRRRHRRRRCRRCRWVRMLCKRKICTSCILYNQNRHAMSCNANSKQHSILLCVAVLHDRID